MVGERRRLRRRRGVGRGVARVVAPLVVVGVIVVLAVGAVAEIGPASGPDRRIVDRSYAVLAGPIVAQSNGSGTALNALLSDGPSLERASFFSDLASITADAAADDRRFAALSPPEPADDVAERCGTAMADRRRATAVAGGALEGLLGGNRGLGGGNEASAARGLVAAGRMLESADGSWAACRKDLRRAPGAARLAASAWVSDPGVWEAGALGRLVAALVSSPSLAAVHRLAIVAVSTDPSTVPGGAGVSVLPPASAVQVLVVLGDEGNVDEEGVRLTVRAVPGDPVRAPAPVRETTDIDAGDSVTISPPELSVRAGTTYVLDITATSETGASVSRSVSLRVASPPPTTTTTTTPPTTTTTTMPRSRTTTTTARSGTTTTTPRSSTTTVGGG